MRGSTRKDCLEKMTEKCFMCLLGLIFLCPLLTGMNVFSSSGENVHLPCNNALSDCTSTTWIYSRQSAAVELIALGIKKKDIERHERLSVSSDCSLNINKVTEEDHGSYSCRQYVNGEQQGTDAPVYLHVLHVSSSSSQTEIRPGSSVTLFCQLYYAGVSCDTLVHADGVELIWVNQAGVNLQTDSRYQILPLGHCNSSLTTTLLNEDHNREWRCQVTQRNETKTSATYTVKYTTSFETKTVTPVSSSKTATTTNTPVTSTQPVSPSVIGIVAAAAALAVLLSAVILWLICKKRADKRRVANDSVEQKDDVTYTEVATYCKIQDKREKVNVDKVTYAAITVTAGPQENCSQLYASVSKNHHK